MRCIVLLCAILTPIFGVLGYEWWAIVSIFVGITAFEFYVKQLTQARACLAEHLGAEVAESWERSYATLAELDRRFVRAFKVGYLDSAFPLSRDDPQQIKSRLLHVWQQHLPEEDDEDMIVWMPGNTRKISFRFFHQAFHAWLMLYGSFRRREPLRLQAFK